MEGAEIAGRKGSPMQTVQYLDQVSAFWRVVDSVVFTVKKHTKNTQKQEWLLEFWKQNPDAYTVKEKTVY